MHLEGLISTYRMQRGTSSSTWSSSRFCSRTKPSLIALKQDIQLVHVPPRLMIGRGVSNGKGMVAQTMVPCCSSSVEI